MDNILIFMVKKKIGGLPRANDSEIFWNILNKEKHHNMIILNLETECGHRFQNIQMEKLIHNKFVISNT